MTSTSTDRRDGINSSVAIKAPVRTATTANITLSGLQTIDGTLVVAGDRVLVKNQTDGTANGIYEADTSVWNRSKDFDTNRDVVTGTIVIVNNVTANSRFYKVTTTGTITVGTTSIAFGSVADISIATGTSTVVADTITALKSLAGMVDSQVVNVTSYYSAATPDGGGGLFKWDAASTATDNGGTIIQPTAGGTGRWRRIYENVLSVKAFGAKGDGTTNDAAAIQAAVDAVDAVYFPASAGYVIGSSVLVPRGTNIYGEGISSPIIAGANNIIGLLKWTGTDGRSDGLASGFAVLDNIFLDRNGKTGVYGLSFEHTRRMTVSRVTADGFARGINVYDCGILSFRDIHVNCANNAGSFPFFADWDFQDNGAGGPYGTFINITDSIFSGCGPNNANCYIRNYAGPILCNVQALGGLGGGFIFEGAPVAGASNPASYLGGVLMTNCAADSCLGNGAYFIKCTWPQIIGGSWSAGRVAAPDDRDGLNFTNCRNITVSSALIINNGRNGLTIGDGNDALIEGCFISNNVNGDVYSSNFLNGKLIGNSFKEEPDLSITSVFVLSTNGTCDAWNVTGNNFAGKPLFIVGANNNIHDNEGDTFFGSGTYDPPSLADGAGVTTTITVTGAALGDYVVAKSFSIDLIGIELSAYVSAPDTVSFRFQNETGGVINLGSGLIRVQVAKAHL